MEWVNILKCTITGKDLRELTSNEIFSLNELRNKKTLWHLNGSLVDYPIEVALVSTNNDYIYPIIKGIVILLSDLAIITDKLKVSSKPL